MARYRGSVATDQSADDLFAYMADIRNFPEWDPGTRQVTQVEGDGPGKDASYRIEVEAGPRTMVLPYTVTTYESPQRVVLQAQTRFLALRDEITVAADPGGATVTYDARVELQGVLRLLDPLFGRVFHRTGERAAEGLASVLHGQRVEA